LVVGERYNIRRISVEVTCGPCAIINLEADDIKSRLIETALKELKEKEDES